MARIKKQVTEKKSVKVDKKALLVATKEKKLAKVETKPKAIIVEPSVKQELIKKYGSHKNDSGSTEVQIALLTNRINQLTDHLKKHGKDSDSRRGLLMMVGKRRRLLNYIAKHDIPRYEKTIKSLGLRK